MAIEMTGGEIVNERGTVVTFRQRCEAIAADGYAGFERRRVAAP